MSGIITDNGSGPATTLTDVYEASYGAAWIQSTNPAGSGGYAIIGQPLLDLQQGSTSWEGYGMCVDTAHWLYLGAPHADYHVYDWATAYAQGKTGTIQSTSDWDRLTYMWSTSSVTSNLDRAALQVASWEGAADQWNIPAGSNWSGANLQITGLDPAVYTRASQYIAASANYTDAFANNYRLLNGDSQTFATAVPEPATLFGAFGLLSSAGLFLKRRKLA